MTSQSANRIAKCSSHGALQQRPLYAPLGSKTKGAIKWSRRFQLFLRLLELNGALGIMVLMILFDNVDFATACTIRIAVCTFTAYNRIDLANSTGLQPGILALHAIYSIYHHAREANGRTPGTSAAYQAFSALFDLVAIAIYTFGAYSAHYHANEWTTRLSNQGLLDYFRPATYYGAIGTGGLHVISFVIAVWLAFTFRKISTLPPDMNPLEDNLTARPSFRHKRSKASMASSISTGITNEKLTTPSERCRSSMVYNGETSPSKVSFMHTRNNSSTTSFHTARDSGLSLPSRQYQIPAANSARNSTASLASTRTFVPPTGRGSYAELPRHDARNSASAALPNSASRDRLPKFTESWAPSESLISRTNNRFGGSAVSSNVRSSKSYSAIDQRYNHDDSDDEYTNENSYSTSPNRRHPNPLGSHPASPPTINRANWTSAAIGSNSALSEITNNDRIVTATRELTKTQSAGQLVSKQRDSSIQHDSFFSRGYGELTAGNRASVIVGGNRKVSSGNDWKAVQHGAERRRVSGKIAEEGLAGRAY